MKSQQLGLIIVAISVVLIGLMIFFKVEVDRQQSQACAEMCGENGQSACSITTCPYRQGNVFSWIPLVASILIAAIGGLGLYLAFTKSEKIIEQKEYDLSNLHDEEKKAFLFVKESNTGLYQSDLAEKMNMSKVKVTRILDKLEQRKLVERKRRGMTNIVMLK